MQAKRNVILGALAAAALFGLAGCGELFLNRMASLGGGTAGGRGTVQVLFINNTPYRAVFTYGSYDQIDEFHQPDFAQYRLQDSTKNLNGDSQSSLSLGEPGSLITCARVFSIGSPELLRLIRENRAEATIREEAMVEGVEFFQIGGEDGTDTEADPVGRGSAPPFEALLGVDFPCAALLIVRFEFDDLGPAPFRIDFELVPAESDR